jgi:hypothetical protein
MGVKFKHKKGSQGSLFDFVSYSKEQGGITGQVIATEFSKDLSTASKTLREQVDGQMVGDLKIPEQFLDRLTAAGRKLLVSKISEGRLLTKRTQSGLRNALNNLISAIEKNTAANIGEGWQVDHQELNIVGIRLVYILEYLRYIRGEVAAENNLRKNARGLSALGDSEIGTLQVSGTNQNVSALDLDSLIADFKWLVAANASLSNAYKTGLQVNPKDMSKLTKDWLKANKYNLDAYKDKVVNVNTKTDFSFRLETEKYNVDIKGRVERILGRKASKLLGQRLSSWYGTWKQQEDSFARDFFPGKPKDLFKIKGSKQIGPEIENQFLDTFNGKARTYKSNTKMKSSIIEKPENKTKVGLKKLGRKKTDAVRMLKQASAKISSAKVGKEKSDEAVNLLKLKRLINTRLGAEVRRNMGRPALTNRTGQFSNSVELLSLRDTGKTLTGQYTYTLTGGGSGSNKTGVYSTFENLGTRKWPTGYNPKPLISKSIRNLAVRYTERKFTLRRV